MDPCDILTPRAVAVAQLVESQIVILVVVGSSPISHPTNPLLRRRRPSIGNFGGGPSRSNSRGGRCRTPQAHLDAQGQVRMVRGGYPPRIQTSSG
jgi:hypothetical protein